MKQKQLKIFILIAILMIIFVSCKKDSFVTSSYKTLDSAATTYDTFMRVAADLHKKGVITDSDKDKIITNGLYFWSAYHMAVEALQAYAKTGQDVEKGALITALAEMSGFLKNIGFYIQPHLEGAPDIEEGKNNETI